MKNFRRLYRFIFMKRRYKFLRKILYSRMIFTFLLLALQIFILVGTLLKFTPYFFYYVGVSISLSFLCAVFISNRETKNEFKIAWMIPTMLFPIVAICLYAYAALNAKNSRIKKRIAESRKKSAEFLPHSEISAEFSDVKDLSFYLSERCGFPSYEDSRVEYFSCGENFLPDFLNEIRRAEKFIFLEFFIINPDSCWDEILGELKKKSAEGVEIRVLYDGIGSVYTSTKAYQKFLEGFGIRAKIYTPLFPVLNLQQNNRDHRKIAVFDGKIAYTGGLNIANEYFNAGKNRFSYWKDSAVKIYGNAAKSFTALFLQTWNLVEKSAENYSRYFPEISAEKNCALSIPYGGDAYDETGVAENICLYILGRAKKSVCITTPYIIVDNQLKNALIFASKRGVKVSLMVPSKPDHFLTFCVGKTYLKTLAENGVDVYLYMPGFLHSKIFLSDDRIATVGSVNLDYRSLCHHFECGTVLTGNSCIKEIKRDFEITKLSCRKMEKGDYEKLPLKVRFFGRLFRIFAPLM